MSRRDAILVAMGLAIGAALMILTRDDPTPTLRPAPADTSADSLIRAWTDSVTLDSTVGFAP